MPVVATEKAKRDFSEKQQAVCTMVGTIIIVQRLIVSSNPIPEIGN